MTYHRSSFHSNSDTDADRQGRSQGQWVPPPEYISAWGQEQTAFQEGSYAGPASAGAGYSPVVYPQQSASYTPEYQSQGAYFDSGSMYQSHYSGMPSGYAPHNPGPSMVGMSHESSFVRAPSMPAGGQPTQWPTLSSNSTPGGPLDSSFYGSNTPPTPGGSTFRGTHGRHPHTPSTQIQLTESEPGDYGGDNSLEGRQCSNCQATSTPLWRRDPRTHKPLCNACGLYKYQRNEDRPQTLIAVDNQSPGGADSDGEYDGPECVNCGTRKTSTWRRNKAGEQVCNACGVYERMNGKPRPLALRNDKIRPRSKHWAEGKT
ncbi:hypothetical protein C8R47DRAFT_589814 [Mycena vitilis]|nr:hypothetical protein C8R47DRAFT_589814 [Mycena vitilis]